MKRLLINGKLAVIEADQYFPFTYKISDLEDINIVNFPSTKSFMLPRNTQNDDLFGHIAEITRLNYGYEDNKSGVSFNQFKKATYELLSDSQIISKGLVRIVNITNDFYEVELYDQAIDLLEELEDKEISELTITNPQTGLPLSERINYETIKDMTERDWGITPIFVDYDSKYTGTKIYGNQEGFGNKVLELPREMTPLQMRTFSAADIPFTMHITKMMSMIENRHRVEFSPYVKELLAYVHMLLKKPKNNLISTSTDLRSNTATKSADDKDLLVWHNYDWLEVENFWYSIFNGNYQAQYEYDMKIETTQVGNIITQYDGVNYTIDNATEGAFIGIMAVDTSVRLRGGGFSQSIFTKIPLYLDRNAFYSKVGNKRTLHLKGSFINTMSVYQKSKTGSNMAVTHSFSGRRWGAGANVYRGKDLNFFGFEGDSSKYNVSSTVTPTVTHKHLDFAEYDLLDSKKLLPSMSIKDFIIDLSKTFNFDISVKDSRLYIDVKRYKMSSEPILLADELDIDVSKVNFSRLEINSGTSQSPLIDEYEEEHNTWASKIINTGYSIKKEEEEVELPYSTPFALTDYNYFAYDLYGLYLNGGYARYPVGNIKGLEGDGLVLGYLGINDETMYVSDAEYIDDEFVISNKNLTRQSGEIGIEWVFNDTSNEVTILPVYSTFLPYRFRDGIIIESLEVNKPHYNFANISDTQYSESTTLYDRFHKRMLEDKFNSNTHVLTGEIFIEGIQDIGKIYNYKNSHYIISELVEYDPTEPAMYEVKLMRVNNTDSYTTLPEITPATPMIYSNLFTHTISSYFQGDVRDNANLLYGFDTKYMQSINDGVFNILGDKSSLRPRFTYENGETKMSSSFLQIGKLDLNNTYKVKTSQSLNYVSGEVLFNDSDELEMLSDGTTSGVIMEQVHNQTLDLGFNTTEYIKTPLTLTNFKKTGVTVSGSTYTVKLELTFNNNTSNGLYYTKIGLPNLRISGIGIADSPILPEDITQVTFNNPGGTIRVALTVKVLVDSPQSGVAVEDISAKILDDGYSIELIPYNTTGVSVKGGFQIAPEAISGQTIFLGQDIINITGNEKQGDANTVRLKRSEVTYYNIIQE